MKWGGGDKMMLGMQSRPSDFEKRSFEHNDTVLENFRLVEVG